jgi:hypothetical protein
MKEQKNVILINSPVLVEYGDCICYQQCSLKEAKYIVNNPNNKIISAIGHTATAEIMTAFLGIDVPLNRIQYKLQKQSDTFLVFRLNERIEEGRVLSGEEIEKIGYELGIISYL